VLEGGVRAGLAVHTTAQVRSCKSVEKIPHNKIKVGRRICSHYSMNKFDFLDLQSRTAKPRKTGLTEVRASYYTVMGLRYLEDILETSAAYIDSVKFAGGAFALYPDEVLRKFIDTCHRYNVLVSTGGYIEHVLVQGREKAERYIDVCKEYGFDIVELSAGFISIPPGDWLRLCEHTIRKGLKAKPEVGVLFGAGGDTKNVGASERKDPSWAIELARRFIEAGAYLVMVESEGITENVPELRTAVPAAFINALGTEKLMFEAADPQVFKWYIKNYGPDVNLFVDHSQILQLECLRRGMWGTQDVWGREVRF
jgi:phosphosulfolactate synthase (CoM biosynthesis protein A)